MARARAPVYREKDTLPMKEQFDQLRRVVEELTETLGTCDLITQLWDAINELEEAAKATIPLSKGSLSVGYGVNAAKKNIACDSAIAILREIKKLKGW